MRHPHDIERDIKRERAEIADRCKTAHMIITDAVCLLSPDDDGDESAIEFAACVKIELLYLVANIPPPPQHEIMSLARASIALEREGADNGKFPR